MRYRRSNIAGGTFFFTVNLADRSSSLLTEHTELLRAAIRQTRQTYPFDITAMVVLPDHLHTIWQLPPGDNRYPLRWSLIKSRFSRAIPKTEAINPSRRHKGERGIWQRRYWEHRIHNSTDLARHVDYIHINPVKHGLVSTPVDWPYSSIHRYITQELLPANWAVDVDLAKIDAGEPE